jgi:SAM-dependent methyltransferase
MKNDFGKCKGILRRTLFKIKSLKFSSAEYWQNRYASNGTSGVGSYNHLAEFKARILNAFVKENGISTVIEFGCGDGNQLALATYPKYIGYDVSQNSIDMCKKLFANDTTKLFLSTKDARGEKAELSLSLDVIYHLVEDAVFARYMDDLFSASLKYVVIYSSDTDMDQDGPAIHVRHRKFSNWIAYHRPEWRLIQHIPNKFPMEKFGSDGSFSEFFIYRQQGEI